MVKILTAREAVESYFFDGATVTFGGFANGLMHPEEIMIALEGGRQEQWTPERAEGRVCVRAGRQRRAGA